MAPPTSAKGEATWVLEEAGVAPKVCLLLLGEGVPFTSTASENAHF